MMPHRELFITVIAFTASSLFGVSLPPLPPSRRGLHCRGYYERTATSVGIATEGPAATEEK